MQLDSEAKLASNTSMIIAASESGSHAPSPVFRFLGKQTVQSLRRRLSVAMGVG